MILVMLTRRATLTERAETSCGCVETASLGTACRAWLRSARWKRGTQEPVTSPELDTLVAQIAEEILASSATREKGGTQSSRGGLPGLCAALRRRPAPRTPAIIAAGADRVP
jgi:hypothetical protein